MGLSYADAVRCGIGHLHPDADPRRFDVETEIDPTEIWPPAMPAPMPSVAPPDRLNKTERRFRDQVLEPAWASGRILEYWREPVKLRLAPRTYYTPDFLVAERPCPDWTPSRLVFLEIKGFMRDDAAVKVKVAAELFGFARWLVVYPDGRSWDVREVGTDGIGRTPITVPWIILYS
jgi:hypothetical protein